MDIWSFNSKLSEQKGEHFYLRPFGGEHREAGSAGNYDTKKNEEDALTANSVLNNYKMN